jgi:hypothetical protein
MKTWNLSALFELKIINMVITWGFSSSLGLSHYLCIATKFTLLWIGYYSSSEQPMCNGGQLRKPLSEMIIQKMFLNAYLLYFELTEIVR